MNFKKIAASALAVAMSGTVLASCSQPNTDALLPFNEEEVTRYTSAVENSALTLYVDSNANDGGDGSESAPFKTVPEAQAKIRELKAGDGLPVGGVTVLVKDGEYKLDTGLTFTEEDSGTAESPITYVSESEFGAVLTGGLILSAEDFEPLNSEERSKLLDDTAKDKVVKVDLKEYGLTETDWGLLYSRGSAWGGSYDNGVGPVESEIFINGERQTLARYPNDGFIETYKVIDTGISHEYYTSIEFNSRGTAIVAYENYSLKNPQGGIFTVRDDICQRMSLWSTLENIWTFGYYKWQWSYSTPPVKSIDIENATIELAQAVSYGVSEGAPFYFYNIFDELDTEGEYYIDRENGILYIYKPENFESAEIMMSCTLDNIVDIQNVSYLTLKGFGICATRSNGISLIGDNCVIDNCKIYNVRGGAINVNGTENIIQNCEITRTGKYGINVTGGDNATLTKGNNLVYNNYIHDWADMDRTYQSAISLSGCGNTASHNEMCNSPHQAVTWSGSYQIFEYNEIYNVCTETGDCGAMYAGRNFTSYGCVQRYNYIHDVGTGDVMAHGIYWDDGLSGQTAYGNIIVNSASSAFLFGGGRDNVVENNIIINAGSSPIHYDQRSRDGMLDSESWFFEHVGELANGLVANRNDIWNEAFPIYSQIIPWYEGYEGDLDDPLLSGNPANNSIKNNISYISIGAGVRIDEDIFVHDIEDSVYMFSEVENNPIVKNNLSDFPGYHNDDYTMREDSTAKELCPDFETIPFDEIGRVD